MIGSVGYSVAMVDVEVRVELLAAGLWLTQLFSDSSQTVLRVTGV